MVAPYCHGTSTRGVEVLRGVQVGGRSGAGGQGFGFGKLWVVAELANLRLSGEQFTPDDPHYNPEDRGMEHIHCRIEAALRGASFGDRARVRASPRKAPRSLP